MKGYYRKDGTYVRPHFRTRPDGITSNNLSAKGISLVEGAKLDPVSYPFGAWPDPIDPKTIHNTPFIGVTADLSSTGVVVSSASQGSNLYPGFRIDQYRRKGSPTWNRVTSWRALTQAALDSGEQELVLQGSRLGGATEERLVALQGPAGLANPESITSRVEDIASGLFLGMSSHLGVTSKTERMAGGLLAGMPGRFGVSSRAEGIVSGIFDGVSFDSNALRAVVLIATSESNLASGDRITGIRTTKQREFTPVISVSDISRFLKSNGEKELVVLRSTTRGDKAVSLVRRSRLFVKGDLSRSVSPTPQEALPEPVKAKKSSDPAEQCG